MSDFATLVLAADSRGLKSGEAALDSLASTAERTEQRSNKATGGLAKGYQAVGKQSIYAGQQSRMMAMQLSQVAQQASATGNWVQALAIQLPDLTLGFGTIGIAAGVAAGALLPLIANMISSGEGAEELDDLISDLGGSLKAYAETVENTKLSMLDLREEFGLQAEQAQRLYEIMRQIRELEFQESLEATREAIAGSLDGISESIDRYNLASLYYEQADAVQAIASEVQVLENQFGLTLIQATRISDALEDMREANGPLEVANAAEALADELARATEEGADLPPELREAQKAALNAALDAARFAESLGAAAGNAAATADQMARMASLSGGMNWGGDGVRGDPRDFEDDPYWSGRYFPDPEKPARKPRAARSRSSRPTDTITDEMREAARIYEETRSAAERYADEIDDLQQLHEMGYLSAETYSRAVAKIDEEYRNASEAGQFFNEISEDLKNGILDAIVEGENLADVFEDLAKSIAKAALEAALFGSGPFAQGGGGGIFGSLFGGLLGGGFKPNTTFGSFIGLPSMDGGGYTGSGSRSGGLDGKGGFLAMMHPQETVIDHSRGQGSTSQSVKVEQHFHISGAVSSEEIKSAIRQQAAETKAEIEGKFAKTYERNNRVGNL